MTDQPDTLIGMSDAPDTSSIPPDVMRRVQEAYKVARDKIDNCDLEQHYRDAIEHLDDNFAFFLTHVLNMGKPEWSHAVPTAAVALPTRNSSGWDDFAYIFNPTFAALLEPEEFAFIMAHETMHILLNHLALLKTGQKKGKFKVDARFNIAADCVINDYLESMGLDPGRVKDMAMFGPAVVGYDCSNSTVSEVYLDIPEELVKQQEQGQGQGGGSGQVQKNGDGMGEYMEGSAPGAGTGGHEWMKDTGQGQDDKAEELAKDAAQNGGTPQDVQDKKQDDDHKGTPGAGPGNEAAKMRKWTETKGVSMKWAELLKQVDPDFFNSGGPRPRPSYHRPRRKLAGVLRAHPDMGVLPVSRDPYHIKGETPAIAMYLDGSGSCSAWIDTFVTLAKSVDPKKIKLFAFTFSTYVAPLDLEAKNPSIAQGGTAFSPIEDSINKDVVAELGHYPKAVVVLTDGEGYFSGSNPKDENKDKWLWLMTYKSRYATSALPGRNMDLGEFCEGMPGIKAPAGRGW